MKLGKIFTAIAAAAMSFASFGMDASAFKYSEFGDVPAKSIVCTNLQEVMTGVAQEVNEKQDKFILGKNLQRGSTVFKLTLGSTDSLGGTDMFPYKSPIYSTGTNFLSNAKIYDYETREIPEIDPLDNLIGARLDDENGQLVVRFRYNNQEAYVPVTGASPVDKLILDVVLDGTQAVGYSHPYDWRLIWSPLDEMDQSEVVESTTSTNILHVTETRTINGLKLTKVKLGIDYMDEINIPEFHDINYSIVNGDATVDGDVVTAQDSGVVNVRATNDLGESRDAEVSVYRYMSQHKYSRFTEDVNANRDRINDWHLNLLNLYRANPTTNRVYYTWNDPTSTKHIGYKGDQFGGQWGKHFFPYQHMTCNSGGGTGFWSTHGIISKHVLLAANHYGDWNHSRAKGMTVYVNWDNKFSGKTAVKLVQYVNLNTWAKENGFTGTDAAMGDIGVYVCRTLDDENVGIPDECLPYIATPDWLNATYGYNWQTNAWGSSDSGGLCCISLNQGATVGLRSTGSLTWSGHSTITTEGKLNYATDLEDPVSDSNYSSGGHCYRKDIALVARRCGFHSVVLGDSGQPVFLYDPAYTVPGKYYDFGNGNEPLVRPMILWSYCSPAGSTSVGLHIKVLKAFCESIGDSLDYILGDPEQSSDTAVVYENAKAANGGGSSN